MAEHAKMNLSHMIVIARRLIAEHELAVSEVANPKATLRKIKELPSVHKVQFLKGGQEKWGPDYAAEYSDFLKTQRDRLERDYPRDRSWWPTALHVLITDGQAKLDAEHPWLAWYEAILGQPYPEFPPGMDWKALIHQVWLDRSREWRFGWEVDFEELYPDASDAMVVGQGGGNIWGEWRLLSYVKGFGTVEGLWEEQTFSRLAEQQDLELLFDAAEMVAS